LKKELGDYHRLGSKLNLREELIQKIRTTSASVAVIGLGRMGLPIAIILANARYRVIGVDNRKSAVRAISSLQIRSKEPDIERLARKAVEMGKLEATANISEAVRSADVIIICVQTPLTRKKEPDLAYLQKACEAIAKSLSKGKLIVIESTVPPGTTRNLVAKILENESKLECGKDFWLAHCPERIAPSKAIQEFIKNARIVGGFNRESAEVAAELLRKVTNGEVLITDCLSAEVAKLAENTFRDVNIAFANELALICERVGVDVMEVVKIANTHPRVNIHQPGCGVGGPCLTKDPHLLLHPVKEKGFISRVVLPSRKLNEDMPSHTIQLLVRALEEVDKHIKTSRVAVLGVAYKGQLDDASNSPAKIIVHNLVDLGADVVVYDPYCEETFGARRAQNIIRAVKGKDCIVIATDHEPFKHLNLKRIVALMNEKPLIVDCRRIIDATEARKNGFLYIGTGYGSKEATGNET
jgi:UDP-N-acetyl-D-mannosaminuronic acid dehydrogenase